MLKMRGLRIDQQARGHGKGRPLGRLRQSGHAERTADTDRAVEDARGKLRQSGQLASATGQSPLAGYLATSPGGLFAVLSIAAETGAGTTFVLAVQVLRIFVMLLVAPGLAVFLARLRD